MIGRGGPAARTNASANGNAPAPMFHQSFARLLAGNQSNRNAPQNVHPTTASGQAAMARNSSNGGAGGSGIAAAMARARARRQEGRVGVDGQGSGAQGGAERGHQGQAGAAARPTNPAGNGAQPGAIEISSGSESEVVL